ncbi:hypothetical protein LCGC14_3016670, partial [marine sediment metagenome]
HGARAETAMIRLQMSLERATGFSFAAHLVFFLFAAIITGNNNSRDMDVYTVRIVSPAPQPVQAVQRAQEVAEPMRRQKVPPSKITPARDSPWLQEESAQVKAQKQARLKQARLEKALALKQARLEHERAEQDRLEQAAKVRELREMREAQQYKDRKIRDLKQKARLDSIRLKAAKPGTPGGQTLTEGQRNKTLADYGESIQAIIRNNWVYALADGDKEFMTRISVTVRVNGMLVINKVVEPSGDRAFDLSALKAIRKTKKVEPPPFEREEEIVLNFYPDN